MNCKPGDLAVIVDSWCGNEGKIVLCVRLHSDAFNDADGVRFQEPQWEPRWVIDPPVESNVPGAPFLTILDADLRPIRDSDGDDEMLRIAGKPQEVNA